MDNKFKSDSFKVPPVLLIVFKRPDLTRRMLESIREAKPHKLYIACDGPRPNRPEDADKVRTVRAVVSEFTSELHPITLYQDLNLGCGKGVSTAISWFFEHEAEGIILEDDCYPDPSFYRFCGEMLERYRNVSNVMQVAGYNKASGDCPIDADYRFSHYGWQWGWATWRRAWAHFDLNMKSWAEFKRMGLHQCAAFYKERIKSFDEMLEGKCDTWDMQWQYAVAANYGLSVVPKYSLITNVGVGVDCTHGLEFKSSQDQKVVVRPVTFPLVHNRFIVADTTYDQCLIKKCQLTVLKKIKGCMGRLALKCGLLK